MTPATLRLGDPGCPGGCHQENGILDWLWPGLVLISPGGQLRLKTRQSRRSEAWPRTCRYRKGLLPCAFLELAWAGKSGPSERHFYHLRGCQGPRGPGQGDPAGGGEGPRPSPAAAASIFPVLGAFPPGRRARPSPRLPQGRDISLSPPPPRPCPSAALGPGAGPRPARGESRRTRASATAPPFLRCPLLRLSALPPLPPTSTLRLAAGAPGLGPQ